jgi:hypothetical protein
MNECMQKPCRAHLLSSEYNHHVYDKTPWLAYSFHELGGDASLVGIIVILPELSLLIQLHFNVVDYVGSLYGQ